MQESPPFQKQGVTDNRDGAKGHGDTGHPWLEDETKRGKHASSQGNPHQIVDHRPQEVETDPLHRSLGEINSCHHIQQIILSELR